MSNRGESRRCEECDRPFEVARAHSATRICLRCRYRGRRNKKSKWVHTEASDAFIREKYNVRVLGRAAEVAAELGWPKWVISKRAQVLGLTYPHDSRAWSKKDVDFLLDWVGDRDVHWIARKLERSLTSVVLKLKRLRISRRVSQGYTLRSLCLCFGTDHHVVDRWVREGKIRVTYGIAAGANRRWKVPEVEVVRFVREHPMAFRLDKVDQPWFLDLFVIKGKSLLDERQAS